jgi:hypothetical protein
MWSFAAPSGLFFAVYLLPREKHGKGEASGSILG